MKMGVGIPCMHLSVSTELNALTLVSWLSAVVLHGCFFLFWL